MGMNQRRRKERRKALAAKVKARFKKRESEGRSGFTGGPKGETLKQYRGRQSKRIRDAARDRNLKFKQTRVRTYGGKRTDFTDAEKRRIIAAGYTVEGYAQAAYSEDGGRAERRARQQKLDKKLSTFDAKSYLNRYADLKAAFGTDEAAARRHYICLLYTSPSPRDG